MLDLLGFLEYLLAWRRYLAWGITALICYLLATNAPNETIAWLACVPIGLAGFVGGLYWQIQSD